ncbi:ATP-dependent DNA helicase RecG [Kozakia baliensis]|uniref:ATP-dependent DNA helicase RecG n=1 Tax=Kozakia baliensis TaxID=153496 RepID=UPI00049549E5|nr:ATP-dependent DNA helicase RecG [Kozakia baliensis]AOX19700.1 ATP-dependent DNA helicase RecG [Kozakia baliensis]
MTEASALLSPLLAPLGALPGIGPRHAGLLRKVAGGPRIIDLLFTLPENLIDRRTRCTLAEARERVAPGGILSAHVRVIGIERPQRQKQPFRVRVGDGTDELDLVFFHAHFLRDVTIGDELAISGKLERYGLGLSMPHPDYMLPWAQRARIPLLDPVWPLTAGLFPSTMRRAMQSALARLPDLPEWQDHALIEKRKWPSFAQALRIIHAPQPAEGENWEALAERARARLAFDELLADQLCMGLARLSAQDRPGRALVGDGALRTEAMRRFGHTPTGAQTRALAEIDADLAAPRPMMRLLQGDVGAGKTLVAAMAMLRAVEAGAQAALMAPTEILARQHFRNLSALCPVPCVFLSGSIKGRARRETLAAIADGSARIVIGTHALFQEKVIFHDLGLAVIDEQHRFGVEQRMRLSSKSEATNALIMTATPIPRTLLLTQWGELQVSRLDEKPPGRLPIGTSMHALSTLEDVLAGIRRALAKGVQVFWVCPLVEESEVLDVAAAEARWADLRRHFGDQVGLAHGRQDISVRQAALDAFQAGNTRLLVATTVIEVGVDVPNASVMVIEHAERFGLAQLHQLRGRVGRGSARSFCLLLFDDQASLTARKRLALLRETEDGFLIADEDFRTRGGGDLAGTRQSGLPGFRLATGSRADLLLTAAWQDSERVLNMDPRLSQPRGQALRLLLHLFDRHDPQKILLSG